MASATAAAKDGVSIAWSWHSMIHLFRNFGGHRAPRGRPWLRCYPKVKGSRCSIHLAARPHANVPFKSHAFETKMCLKNTITGDTPHIPKFGSWQLSCSKRDQVLEEMRRTEALHSVRFKKKNQSLLRNFGNWCFWWDRCFFQTLLTSLNKRLRSKGTWSPVKKQNKRQNLGISVLFFSRKNGFRRSVETAVDVQLLIYPKFHVGIQCRMIDTPKSWWYTESNRIIRYKDRI